jgi:sigma-B regulation protein RsbU (phosphoserine phosphatase)
LILWALALLAALFLVIEVSAIFVGLVLARSITGSVHALSQGTEHVRHGDFGYKVHVRSRDQLGELADSFNLMTTSIEDLLRQSAEKERLEEELRVARTIQMNLLPPKERMRFPGLSIAPLCLPATEVGGDYYDFLPLGDGRLALLIADVSGKGTSAALYMAELKGLVLSLSRVYSSPRSLLIEANKILAENLDSRSFITMAYAIIDMNERRMTYARAGHNPIFHICTNGGGAETRVLAPEGIGLALDRGGRFESILEEDSVELRTGDFFLFFTDGISEAMNDRSELFGEDRLRVLLEENADLQMEELREKVVDEVFSFAGGAVQHDDMTMVLVKVL